MDNERKDRVTIPEGYSAEQYYSEQMEKMKTGDADATFKAGLCFRDGIGCTQSETNFAACLMVAANKGHETANALCSELGPDFFIRTGDEFRNAKIMPNALQSYLWAFKLKDRTVCVKLADMYAEGLGTQKDTQLAARFLHTGAEAGIAEAQYRYSEALSDGKWVKQNEEAANEWCLKAAEQGYVSAMLSMGIHDWAEEGDVFTAEEWFRKAADTGDREGMRLLGELDAEELAEPEEAFEMLTRAAELGSKDAELDLGKWYLFEHEWLYGRAYEAESGDHEKAAEILRRLAEEEDFSDAYYYWGLCLLDGYGVTADVSRSMEWLKKAAEHNSADAQKLMGYLIAFNVDNHPVWTDDYERSDFYGDATYFNKRKKSISEKHHKSWMEWHEHVKTHNALRAIKWYRMAAEQGDAEAAEQLCILSRHVLEEMQKDPENSDKDLMEEISGELEEWTQALSEFDRYH